MWDGLLAQCLRNCCLLRDWTRMRGNKNSKKQNKVWGKKAKQPLGVDFQESKSHVSDWDETIYNRHCLLSPEKNTEERIVLGKAPSNPRRIGEANRSSTVWRPGRGLTLCTGTRKKLGVMVGEHPGGRAGERREKPRSMTNEQRAFKH